MNLKQSRQLIVAFGIYAVTVLYAFSLYKSINFKPVDQKDNIVINYSVDGRTDKQVENYRVGGQDDYKVINYRLESVNYRGEGQKDRVVNNRVGSAKDQVVNYRVEGVKDQVVNYRVEGVKDQVANYRTGGVKDQVVNYKVADQKDQVVKYRVDGQRDNQVLNYGFDFMNADQQITQSKRGETKSVYDMIDVIIAQENNFFPDWYWTAPMKNLSNLLNGNKRKNAAVVLRLNGTNKDGTKESWTKFEHHMQQYSLYDPDDHIVEALLRDMATLPIVKTNVNQLGTQLKINVELGGGGRVLLKPMRYQQLKGYNKRDGRVCFYGRCRQGCKKKRSFCGSPDTLEVSMMYYLPNATHTNATLLYYRNPWKVKDRAGDPIHFRYMVQGKWISGNYLCKKTRLGYSNGNQPPQLPLELLDVKYFDLLIDNFDRHHYAIYDGFNYDTIPILFDNGRAFGNPSADHLLNYFFRKGNGCCLMKKTTFLKYLKLFLGPESLSELMRCSLRSDPADPVLPEDQLQALDRRVRKTILYIRNCLEEYSLEDVIINDM